jgi:hypothetical protein
MFRRRSFHPRWPKNWKWQYKRRRLVFWPGSISRPVSWCGSRTRIGLGFGLKAGCRAGRVRVLARSFDQSHEPCYQRAERTQQNVSKLSLRRGGGSPRRGGTEWGYLSGAIDARRCRFCRFGIAERQSGKAFPVRQQVRRVRLQTMVERKMRRNRSSDGAPS